MDDGTATLRGLTIGDGTAYPFAEAPVGVLDTPDIRVVDTPRPMRHGVIPGADYLAGRLVTFTVHVVGDADDPASAEQLTSDLAAAWAPSDVDVWLDVRITGTPSEYAFLGRPRGAVVALNLLNAGAVAAARCSFMATDPTRFGPQSSTTIALAMTGGGLEYSVEYPLAYGNGGGAGIGDAANVGSAQVDWSATLNGPLINPRLEHVDSGRFVKVSTTIAAGSTVVLDSSSGAILLDGTAPRPAWMAPGSSWFRLAPGSNALRLTADSGSGDVDVVWRSGWV